MISYAEGNINDTISVAGDTLYPAYIVRGTEKNIMIDAGINQCGPMYLKGIEKILGDPALLDFLIVTHSHYDHVGAVPYLKRKIPGLQFGGAPMVGKLMQKKSVIEHMNRLSSFQEAVYKDSVGNEDVRIDSIKLNIPLKEGNIIDLGGITCEVYETPGHTRDSLSFFLPEQGVLFSGEALGLPDPEKKELAHVIFLSSAGDYIRSIEKLTALKPKTICFGHGFVITGSDVEPFLKNTHDQTFTHIKMIKTYLAEANGDVGKAIDAIMEDEYDKPRNIPQERNAYLTNLSAQVRHVAETK